MVMRVCDSDGDGNLDFAEFVVHYGPYTLRNLPPSFTCIVLLLLSVCAIAHSRTITILYRPFFCVQAA